MLKRLLFLKTIIRDMIDDDVIDLEDLTAYEWKICNQVCVTLTTMVHWQRVLEGEKYVTGSLVPLAIASIISSYITVIRSNATLPMVKQLTRILLKDFDQRYNPRPDGKLRYSSKVQIGHGQHYTGIHHYFFRAAYLDPHVHPALKKLMTAEDLQTVSYFKFNHLLLIHSLH